MTDPEIICIGAAHWDVIARTDLPLPRGADVPGAVTRRPGGVAANVALGLARLGRRVGLISVLGTDREGDQLQTALEAARVDCAFMCRTADHPTSSYVAIEGADGELLAAIADCAALEAPELIARLGTPEDWLLFPSPHGDFHDARALFVDANLSAAALNALPIHASTRAPSLFVNAVSPAKAVRLRRMLDGDASSGLPKKAVAIAQLYATCAEAEAMMDNSFGTALEAACAIRAAGFGFQNVVVTDGARPAASAASNSMSEAAPLPVTARSVTGAGDALIAAHLDAILGGATPDAALRTGLAAAAAHISGEAP